MFYHYCIENWRQVLLVFAVYRASTAHVLGARSAWVHRPTYIRSAGAAVRVQNNLLPRAIVYHEEIEARRLEGERACHHV